MIKEEMLVPEWSEDSTRPRLCRMEQRELHIERKERILKKLLPDNMPVSYGATDIFRFKVKMLRSDTGKEGSKMQEDINNIELKKCPFCGGEAELKQWWPAFRGRRETTVQCTVCRGNSGTWKRKDKAIEAWQKRTRGM